MRAAELEAIEALLDALPAEIDGVGSEREVDPALAGDGDGRARARRRSSGRRSCSAAAIVGAERGGASDASHLAAGAPLLAIDGLGPLGGGSHAPDEHIVAASLRTRAEVALALVAAAARAPR